jgi:glycosyltransferase involved in cell wall biosynthesis
MRVLHLLKTATGGEWALRLVRELVKHGIDIHVAVPPGPMTDRYAATGAHIHTDQFDLPVNQPWLVPARLRRLRRLVDHVAPDLIHSHFVGTTITMRLALGRDHPVPRVFQVPGPLHLEHGLFRHLDLSTAGTADYWIGTCAWTCDRYARSGVPPHRRFLSYYGTDLARFGPVASGRLHRELGVSPTTRLVGMVAFMYAPKRYLGQVRGIKGHEDLIDAVAICLRRGADVTCVFAGGAWNGTTGYEHAVRAYARRRIGSRAIFLGTRTDIPHIYADLDVAVHPSHSENVGGAVESLLAAVPTVATDVGGFPDVITPGETGWLVPPHSPAPLADAILSVLNTPAAARAMAIRGRDRVRRMFDVTQTAAQVAGIYAAIHSGRRAGMDARPCGNDDTPVVPVMQASGGGG